MKDLLTNKFMIGFMIFVLCVSFANGKIESQKNAVADTTTVKNLTK